MTISETKFGFQFDNYLRNQSLGKQFGNTCPKATSTGTTIVGLVCKDGIVLGADTRATSGPIVADKNCEKIHYLSPRIFCCGAGTAADTEFVTAQIRSSLDLYSLNSRRSPRVIAAVTMLKQKLFRHQGHIGAALIVGGVDCTGPGLFTVHPHGSTDKLPYVTMGSGSLAAMAVFESKYHPNMDKDSAVLLVSEAIQAGIFNDLGSGSNVDVVVIPLTGLPDIKRGLVKPNPKPNRQLIYTPSPGTAVILKEEFVSYAIESPSTL